MYSIHTTPGFIIDSRPSGEAGKLLFIFTRDLGLVLASAQGIRLEKSKLRYRAQEYSFGVFSFVRGKEFWKLINASEYEIPNLKSQIPKMQELLARVALLLKRLLHGEEPNVELFDAVEGCANFLQSRADVSEEQMKSLESLVVLRILHYLGYIGKDVQLVPFFQSVEITPELLAEAASLRLMMNQHINKALKESHL